jgi:hypothetical protein
LSENFNRQAHECIALKELSGYFARPRKSETAAQLAGVSEPERRTFLMANMVAESSRFIS